MKGTDIIFVYLLQRQVLCKVRKHAKYSTHFMAAMRIRNNSLAVTFVSEVGE